MSTRFSKRINIAMNDPKRVRLFRKNLKALGHRDEE